MKIPTPIPRTIGKRLEGVLNAGSLILAVWRLLVLTVLAAVAVLWLLVPPSFVVSLIAGIIASQLFADEIVGTAKDVWNLRFWGVEV